MEQRNPVIRKIDRGIALLAAMLALLLLGAIGLGMMYSTNMETAINYNYRDKQVSFYAAQAGLQEARERIKYPYNITPPTSLPSTTLQNVIYIVSDALTVKPWDPSNAYFDTELCQERTLSLTPGTLGVPCTATASGTGWYQVFDNSLLGAAPWNLSPPDWKWTRIQLKANNNTPIAVNGDSSISAQACWTGTNQLSTPSTYTAGCRPIGGVTAVPMLTKGTGFTTAPTVAFSGGGGSGATATAVLGPEITGYISSITVTAGGSGYSSSPTVNVASGSATATAVLSTTGTTTSTPGSVISVPLTTGGSGYTTAPTVTLSGGGGSGATATAVLSMTGTTSMTGYVNALTLTAGGSNYTSAPTVTLSGGGGSGATATATLGTVGTVKSVAIDSLGTQCYLQATDAVVSFSGGGGSGAAASAVLETGRSCVHSVNVPGTNCSNQLNLAAGYNPKDVKTGVTSIVGNHSFSGTLFVQAANDKTPVSMSVQNPGYDASGYSPATFTSNLQLTGGAWPDCNNISVTVTTGYRIASINVTNGGSGYASTPAVSITGGVGTTSNPTATATRGFPVTGWTITSGGTNYTSAPAVSFSGGGGAGVAATSSIVTTSTTTYPVASVNVTSGGTGYTSAPAVAFSGGGGSGAAATATVMATTVTTYPVASIIVVYGGTGYDPLFPPAITLSGGGGSGATATAVMSTMATGSFFVDHINVVTPGTGYTSDPTVTLSGGGGSGATAAAQVSGGTKYGKVWLLTSLAQTRTKARTMLQMEVASPVLGFALGGALTLDGPNPVIDAMPNSINFRVQGNDANSCVETAEPDHPAIDGFDDPNANPPTQSVETIIDSLPRPDHYTGAGGTPSVQNGFAELGETMTTPAGLDSVMSSIYNTAGAQHYDASNVGTFNPVTTMNTSITYVDGNLTLSGNDTGRGILVVTGTLTMSGNFNWYGLVFVVGDGHVEMSGGGNGIIVGSIFVAKIWDSNATKNLLTSMGAPTFNWNGGGGNGVYYDHCYATNLMTAVPLNNLVSTRPLKALSFKILPY